MFFTIYCYDTSRSTKNNSRIPDRHLKSPNLVVPEEISREFNHRAKVIKLQREGHLNGRADTISNLLDMVLGDTNDTKDSSKSVRILFDLMKQFTAPVIKSTILQNSKEETERCQRYGFQYDSSREIRRRLFWGSLIADDSWHSILPHAAEAHGVYHTVAFIESNKTTSYDKSQFRKERFTPGSPNVKLLQSGLFGPSTKVIFDHYVDDPEMRSDMPHLWYGMGVEFMARDMITKIWKAQGMLPEDIGIIGDTDEFFTRDFMLALQSCDVPELRANQNCISPGKLIGKTLVFESSPECVTNIKRWYHPDLLLGECIENIGDPTVHRPAPRHWNGKGPRHDGYTPSNRTMMRNRTMYPLWKPDEMRLMQGGRMATGKAKHTAFHLHNFFPSTEVLRKKYRTYSHPHGDAYKKPLGNLSEDVDLAVNCVTDRPDKFGLRYPRLRGGFQAIDGPKPILFERSAEYRVARHQEFKEMVLADEKEYGKKPV